MVSSSDYALDPEAPSAQRFNKIQHHAFYYVHRAAGPELTLIIDSEGALGVLFA
jgi:hypothetical protein